jgi:hypothetical protein
MRKLAYSLVVIGLLAALSPAMAVKKNPADYLDAPQNFTADVVGVNVVFDWDDVTGAEKYSVDVEATVTVFGLLEDVVVELSYGTSDRTDGGGMGDSDLTVPLDTLLADLAAELGVSVGDILEVDAEAKVKALNPGDGNGAQNNPYSDPDDFAWIAP